MKIHLYIFILILMWLVLVTKNQIRNHFVIKLSTTNIDGGHVDDFVSTLAHSGLINDKEKILWQSMALYKMTDEIIIIHGNYQFLESKFICEGLSDAA